MKLTFLLTVKMEALYRSIKTAIGSAEIEWISPNSFKVKYNDKEYVFDEEHKDTSILGISVTPVNRPSNRLPDRFSRYMNLNIARVPYRTKENPHPQREYDQIQLDFKKDILVTGITGNPVMLFGVKGFDNISIHFPYTCGHYSVNEEFDNAVITNSEVWEKFKHEYEFDRRGGVGAIFEPVNILESHLQARYMFRNFENNDIYSSYFKYHKPDELIALDNARITVLENAATFTLRSMNNLSNKCSGLPFIHNVFIKAVGFELHGQTCSCPIDKWNRFKEFMKVEVVTSTKFDHGGVYILQLNCDKGTNKYKIGKASNLLTRLKSTEYRNAFIISCCAVNDINGCEKEIIAAFNDKFKNVKESMDGGFGNEIFEGDIKEMLNVFWAICLKFN